MLPIRKTSAVLCTLMLCSSVEASFDDKQVAPGQSVTAQVAADNSNSIDRSYVTLRADEACLLRNRHIETVILANRPVFDHNTAGDLQHLQFQNLPLNPTDQIYTSIYTLLAQADKGDLDAQELIATRYFSALVHEIPVPGINWQAWTSAKLNTRSNVVLGFLSSRVKKENQPAYGAAIERHILKRVYQRDPFALYIYARSLEQGYLNFSDETLPVVFYMMSAQQGCVQSIYHLGNLALDGKGLVCDPALAISCYLQAAHLGFLPAVLTLRQQVRNGFLGAGLDEFRIHDISCNLLRQAAKARYPYAMFLWGLQLIRERDSAFPGPARGIGEHAYQVRTKKIFSLLECAASQGLLKAQVMVGGIQRRGDIDQPNTPAALEWYLKAAKQGCLKSKYWYGSTVLTQNQLNFTDEQRNLAVEYLKQVALSGNKEAQYEMALLLRDGFLGDNHSTLTINKAEALRWMLESGRQRFWPFLQLVFRHGHRRIDSILKFAGTGEFRPIEAKELAIYQPPAESAFIRLCTELDGLVLSVRTPGSDQGIPNLLEPACLALNDYSMRLCKVWPAIVKAPIMVTNFALLDKTHINFEQQTDPHFLHVYRLDRINYLTLGVEGVSQAKLIEKLLNPVGICNWTDVDNNIAKNVACKAMFVSNSESDPQELLRILSVGSGRILECEPNALHTIVTLGDARSCVYKVLDVLSNAKKQVQYSIGYYNDAGAFGSITMDEIHAAQAPLINARTYLDGLTNRFERILILLNATEGEFNAQIAKPRLRNASAEQMQQFMLIKEALAYKY